MVEGKQVHNLPTDYMGYGLFTKEDIGIGEYIVRYNGTWHNDIPAVTGDCLVSVRMVSKDRRSLTTCIDGTKYKSIAKFLDHSCLVRWI